MFKSMYKRIDHYPEKIDTIVNISDSRALIIWRVVLDRAQAFPWRIWRFEMF